MEIIKKKGNIEKFNILKVKQSIMNVANEIGQSLTDADLKVIQKNVEDLLKSLKRETTSSYEVFAIVLRVLSDLDFDNIAKAYFEGSL